jgi:HEAT repeat protein
MARGPLIAAGALVAVAGGAALLVVSNRGPEPGLDGTLTSTPTTAVETVAPPATTDAGTGPLVPATLVVKRPKHPFPAGPTEGPKGPGSKFSAKRGTQRESVNQRAGRLLDNLEQAVAASDGTAIEDMVKKLLAMGEEALPDIIDALQRAELSQRKLRKALVNALARIPRPEAAEALRRLALDGSDDRELRKIATLALAAMPAEVSVDPLTRIYKHRGDAGNFGFVRIAALDALGRAGGDDAYAVVRDAAEFEEDLAVRRQAVAALGSAKFAGQTGQVEMLLKKVRTDADEGVRRWAMHSLGANADPRAREELAGLMREWPDSSTRVTLYHSLQMRKDPAVEGVLAESLLRETEDVMVKRAAGALWNVLGKGARKYLVQSRDRFQNREGLRFYFDSMLRAIDSGSGGGHGGVKPPGAPK